MSKTFYSAYTCKNNLGDLIINKMQIEEYSKYGEVYVDFTGMPDNFKNILLNQNNPNIKDFTATYGQSYRGKHFIQVIKLLKKEGFTHFTKSPGPYAVLSLPLKKLTIRLIGALGYMTANHLGLKVFAFGIDLDYTSNQPKWLRLLNVKYFSLYNSLGLRSLKNYEECKNDLNNTRYVPDMAILYNPQPYTNINRRRIALSFRYVAETEILLKELKEILPIFFSKGYAVDIIFQVEEDRLFAKVLAKSLKEYNLNVLSQCIWYDNLDTYSKYDYVFSNRLHVLLLAAKYGAIPLALISKDLKEQKIQNIFNSISLGYLVRHIGFTNKEQWIELLSNKEAIKHEVNNALEYQKQIQGEQEKIKSVREYVKTITGFRSLHYDFAKENQGLGNSIIHGVSTVINQYGTAIIIEDDLVLAPNFLAFMNEGLQRYKDEQKIFSICGYSNKVKVPKGYAYDTYFCTRSSSWGWATWADRWNSVNWDLKDFGSYRQKAKEFNRWGGSDCWKMLHDWHNGKNKSWAIRFCFAQFLQDKLSLFPIISKINNEGFDGEGTNCKRYSRFKFTFDTTDHKTFSYPMQIEVNKTLYKSALSYHNIMIRVWSRIMYIIYR